MVFIPLLMILASVSVVLISSGVISPSLKHTAAFTPVAYKASLLSNFFLSFVRNPELGSKFIFISNTLPTI